MKKLMVAELLFFSERCAMKSGSIDKMWETIVCKPLYGRLIAKCAYREARKRIRLMCVSHSVPCGAVRLPAVYDQM